ncbi:histidine kinase N-terminal 7TM domain-containing diguanylate cyclase/phosphohydrolase [Parasporobacterium paucivorans]|uniref:Diguanylate cyclase (GGDEF) domain-containing protein n=1 Tax=Parasporobacterium paucivorans DSM 15970 TaxID=1122934 RepID=A0A1M6GZU2_9FIRM|nr:HD domain-containing phosphohydrolase [Parasporobacterium paucivorans]SHJ15487.1 diguanylate cyclase (GGDEF) domain-containing protein [Parasporobacterium paucivorans DSM 15970]
MGSFAFISIIALLCYVFLLLALLAAKKNTIVNAFLLILAALILWTGGSFCMRMQLWPGLKIWYDVSILGLTLLAYAFYFFVSRFADLKKTPAGKFWLAVIIIINIINVATGYFLAAPKPEISDEGEVIFVYQYTWAIIILFGACALIILHMLYNLFRYYKNNTLAKGQFMPILIGIIVLFAGNIGIMLPFFTGFPTDILAGIINALFMFYALYKRKLFQLKLVISRGTCYVVTAGLSFVIFYYMISPLEKLITEKFSLSSRNTILVIVVIFTLFALILYYALKRFLDKIFIRDEIMQAESLKNFSLNASKSLDVSEILKEITNVIQKSISVRKIFICIADKKNSKFEVLHSTNPLENKKYNINVENPLIAELEKNNECLMMKDFRRTTEYKSMWEAEKKQLQELGIECAVPLMDDSGMMGIVFLCEKEKKAGFTYNDIVFLNSVKSIGSIAVKNSRLFEQAYMEARTDDLTGLLNRKYFYEILQQEFENNTGGCLSLIILNLDDFKLYNQLYGIKEGDNALRKVARIVKASVGASGHVARYSGKEFAIILPKYDLLSSKNLAEIIRKQIMNMNRRESDYTFKMLTVSGGISSIPYSASTVKELIENADMAIYKVKHSGKNAVMVHVGRNPNPEERTATRSESKETIYLEYEQTIGALTAAIDTKDHYTFKHSRNVAYYATELAYGYGMDEDFIEIVRESALLHDVGKIGIPEQILNKEDKLSDEEFSTVKGHVENSIGIIRNLPSLDYVIPAVIGHHERYDGNGYPRKIAGNDIPLSARILCVADAFDAMTTKRPYKAPLSVGESLQRLQEDAGLQFDPELVPIFVGLVNQGVIKICED